MSNDLLKQLAELALPTPLSHKLYNAQEIVDAANMAAALDRLAITLTVTLQDRSPVLLALLPDSSYLLGALMQRMVFPAQVVHAVSEMSDVLSLAGDAVSLENRAVLVVDSGLVEPAQMLVMENELRRQGASQLWRCSLLRRSESALPQSNGSGFEQWFSAVICDATQPFGCGLDLLGYCRNLPSLYAVNEVAQPTPSLA